ncbi:acetolactate synthase large subunit [Pseudooceanicola batsensis]|uniref:acetolactate synthase large subunit n=1 Tax=Pseudooceanicola batsensis TaxID=314255 RepID=UPI001EE6628C|nr:acetolactate synthase large subunit [Pseudooceanicola batsensis]
MGDHASYHLPHDAALTTDIESLARPMSGYVRRIGSVEDVAPATAEAVGRATQAPGAVSTLILPANFAWGQAPRASLPKAMRRSPPAADPDRVRAAGKALKNGAKTVILLSGSALRAEALKTAQDIAAASGATLLAQQANARMERGAGRVPINRVPYPVDQAMAVLDGTEQLILVGAKAPVAFFAYPGKPGSPLPDGCEISTLAEPGEDLAGALQALSDEISAAPAEIGRSPAIPDLASGKLTPETIAITLGHHMPENAVVCDESVTSGRDFFRFTFGAAPHDWLQLTGGAIGVGLPLSVGAAIACPDRKIVNLQADGSAMYTNQALWTMARERLDVCVVIFSNRRYAILHGELKGVGAGEAGRNARRMLDFDDPAIDWVKLAQSMGVEAASTETAEGFTDLFKRATHTKGPFLIEAVI